MILKGKVWKYGDNIDTDVIIPGRYCVIDEPEELAKHCLEGLDPEFVKKVRPGDILVVGSNFGCGSSREHAPLAIKGAGISCIIAVNFARIFFRNAINIGLPIFESDKAVEVIEEGDGVEVDPIRGVIWDRTRGVEFFSSPLPSFIQEIVEKGGLKNYVKEKLKNEKTMPHRGARDSRFGEDTEKDIKF